MDRKTLLQKYNLSAAEVEKAGVDWAECERIRDDFQERGKLFHHAMVAVADHLRDLDCVHSIRARLKDPEHLLIKCIRKRVDNPERSITVQNYREEITDLIGIRALHLLKEEWLPIHGAICKMWEPLEPPIAYIRKGDSEAMQKEFKDKGCVVKERASGYRSIHYLVHSKPTRETYIAEIQVRTIFEEAWSELDHRIRYPYKCDPLLGQYLDMFNRIAGSADEMASFVWHLERELKENGKRQQEALTKKDAAITALEQEIKSLHLNRAQQESLQAKVRAVVEFAGKFVGGLAAGAGIMLTEYQGLPRGSDGRIRVEVATPTAAVPIQTRQESSTAEVIQPVTTNTPQKPEQHTNSVSPSPLPHVAPPKPKARGSRKARADKDEKS